MKEQLVASVIIQVSGTRIDHEGKRPKYPTFRQAVYHVRLRQAPSGENYEQVLHCACGGTRGWFPGEDVPRGFHGCFHIEKLYKNELEGVTFTQLGRDMFFPLYTVQALAK